MKQYWDIKNEHQDKVLFFRMGDFYELFFSDAETVAPLVGLTLTKRNKKSQDETPMCGLPHFAVAGPINKLLALGFKVALCDQVEDPKKAKGLVKRAVTRILTPGMVLDIDQVAATKNIYLAAFDQTKVLFFESTTSEAFCYHIQSLDEATEILSLHDVAELVVAAEVSEEFRQQAGCGLITVHAADRPDLPADERLMSYLKSLGASPVLLVKPEFTLRERKGVLQMSRDTVKHLELFETYKGEVTGSLFWHLDRTQTPLGARRLKQWLRYPLLSVSEIRLRQNRVRSWTENPDDLKKLQKNLRGFGDLERKLIKLTYPSANSRDLWALANGLRSLAELLELFDQQRLQLDLSESATGDLIAWADRLLASLVDEPPVSTKDGGMIREGVLPELDEWIRLNLHSQSMILEMEARERESLSIPSLKIRYNQIFGYAIEVTNTHKSKVPGHYQRKQTLAQAERFVTPELMELEQKILSAREKREQMESQIFEDLRTETLQYTTPILNLAKALADLDAVSSLAAVAAEEDYTVPIFHETRDLKLEYARHPVIAKSLGLRFVGNDLHLLGSDVLLLTGPNMAGKSTLMRQTALLVILAQMGSFVSARAMQTPIFDSVFTRIGASDYLSEGLSTFMVEMKEMTAILAERTTKSLIILDEIGRGTSTFDGLALAQAILEHLLNHPSGLTLFATHYHELPELEAQHPHLRNCHLGVRESEGRLEFSYSLVKGAAKRSYGIQVARLAGLPREITQRAERILKVLQAGSGGEAREVPQMSLFSFAHAEPAPKKSAEVWLEKIKDLQIDGLSPLQAFDVLRRWKDQYEQDLSQRQ